MYEPHNNILLMGHQSLDINAFSCLYHIHIVANDVINMSLIIQIMHNLLAYTHILSNKMTHIFF